MAKEQIHHYLRTCIILAGIVFAGGGYAMQIKSNSDKITEEKTERVEADKMLIVKVDQSEDDIHLLALNSKDTQALTMQTAKAFVSIESKINTVMTRLNEQATVQAVNSATLKTLTKD